MKIRRLAGRWPCQLAAVRNAYTERAHRKIVIAFPDLFTACQLHQNGGRRRLELESRILARQAPELIAELMGLPLHTVQAFRTFFFDLADRLDAAGYVMLVMSWRLGQPLNRPPRGNLDESPRLPSWTGRH